MTFQASRRGLVLDSFLCLVLIVMATLFYSALFLHVPVLTEVRDFFIYQGWGAQISDLFVPTGNDTRPLSWSFFAWQHRVFPFNVTAVNLVQFILLGVGASLVFIHVRQLLGKRTAAIGVSVLWILSLPAIHAAFWQATQHDKLAFIFVLLTLIVSLYAIRLDRPKLIPVFTLLILMSAAVSVATKPVAFMLPGALLVQVVLFTPQKNLSGYRRALILIMIPTAYAIAYVTGYLLKMDAQWLAHATGGDIPDNLFKYARNVTNRDWSGSLWLAIALITPVGIAWLHALWRWPKQVFSTSPNTKPQSDPGDDRDTVLIYLCAIFLGSIVVLARARYSVSFYVLLPTFAYFASLATIAVSLFANRSLIIRRSAGVIATVMVTGLLLNCWTSVMGSSNLGQWRLASSNLANGYDVLRTSVKAENVRSVKFFFPQEPPGYFYFFSDGTHLDIDPALPSFIFRRELTAPIENYFGETPPINASPGVLSVVWSNDLQLLEARLGQAKIYTAPSHVPGKSRDSAAANSN